MLRTSSEIDNFFAQVEERFRPVFREANIRVLSVDKSGDIWRTKILGNSGIRKLFDALICQDLRACTKIQKKVAQITSITSSLEAEQNAFNVQVRALLTIPGRELTPEQVESYVREMEESIQKLRRTRDSLNADLALFIIAIKRKIATKSAELNESADVQKDKLNDLIQTVKETIDVMPLNSTPDQDDTLLMLNSLLVHCINKKLEIYWAMQKKDETYDDGVFGEINCYLEMSYAHPDVEAAESARFTAYSILNGYYRRSTPGMVNEAAFFLAVLQILTQENKTVKTTFSDRDDQRVFDSKLMAVRGEVLPFENTIVDDATRNKFLLEALLDWEPQGKEQVQLLLGYLEHQLAVCIAQDAPLVGQEKISGKIKVEMGRLSFFEAAVRVEPQGLLVADSVSQLAR